MLSNKLFKILCDKFQFSPQVDLFATRLNKQIDKYVSWMPEPYCTAVNAFNFSWKTHKIYAFQPFSLVGAAISKLIRDNTIGIMIIPTWTTQYWFPTMLAHLVDHAIQFPSGLKILSLPFKPSKRSLTVSEASTFSSHPIVQSLERFSLPREIEEVILAAWKPKTAAKYKSFIDRWKLFCIRGSENCYTPSVNSALKLLYYLYKNGCYYFGLSSARSALSTIVHIDGYSKLSDHPLISKFMKGIYNQHPTLPRYVNIWDINVLWAYFEPLPTDSELTLKCLTEKLTVLLLILSEQRKQILLAIDIDNVKSYEDKLIILSNSSLKHTKPSRPLQAIVYHKVNGNPKLCVVECAKFYIEIRKELVPLEIKQFLVTYGKPHKAVSDDTISR